MAARLPFLLPAIALVLAGCSTGDSHGGHDEPAILLGLANELGSDVDASWVLFSPNSTVVWEGNESIANGKTEENLFAYRQPGEHLIRVEWDGGNGTVTYDPTDCRVLTHIILTLAPEGLAETKRECHDD